MVASDEIVVDASVVLAVLLNEPEKVRIVDITRGKSLLSPGCLRWEVGNAFSAMFKRHRLSRSQADEALSDFGSIPIKDVEVDLRRALELCERHGIYAYDAYYLEAARKQSRPLMTLDGEMNKLAKLERIRVEEV